MVKTTIASFDPASTKNLGWSLICIDENKSNEIYNVAAGTFVFPQYDEEWQVLWPIWLTIEDFILKNNPNIIIIEKTSSFRGGFVTGQVSNCIGVLLSVCGKYKIPVSFVFPSHVKKVLTGNGKATKVQIKKSVVNILKNTCIDNTLNFKYDSDHAYDALANILCCLIEKKIIDINFNKE